jgi:hypothetical protein
MYRRPKSPGFTNRSNRFSGPAALERWCRGSVPVASIRKSFQEMVIQPACRRKYKVRWRILIDTHRTEGSSA